ncbi:MAG: MBOAT family O-acyltransferase [Terriglobia bacterium]
MTFTSFEFVVFLPLVVALYRVCPVRLRSAFLLIASYLFYCTWSVKGAAALAGATVLTFFAAQWVGSAEATHRAKVTALVAVCLLTGYLAFFKMAAVVPVAGLGRIALPLGISYYTFKLLSYIIDVHWGKIEPERSFITFAAYVAFFPQMIAGPIQRPGDFFGQLAPAGTAIWEGALRLAWGLGKKILIADHLAPTVSYVFSHVQGLHGAPLWAGFYLFPLQLYADFSGLTDIAIGTGRLFGILGPENFNRPYTASSISQFWRRWHMSLTTWLTDYVFTPLRMATRRAGKAGLALSITVNMVAIGLWHGLKWGWFIFGLLNATYMVVDALTSRRRARFFKAHPRLDRTTSRLGWLVTFHLVAIALVFFSARTVSDATWLLSHLWVGLGSFSSDLARLAATTGGRGLALGLVGYAGLELAERFRPDNWWRRVEPAMPPWARWWVRSTAAVLLPVGVLLLVIPAATQQAPFRIVAVMAGGYFAFNGIRSALLRAGSAVERLGGERTGPVGRVFVFSWQNKWWFLAPAIIAIAALWALLFSSQPASTPFIYARF